MARGLLATLTAALLAQTPAAAQEAAPLRVLLLQSFHDAQPYMQNFRAGLEAALDAAGRPYVLHVEHLDAARLPGAERQRAWASFLAQRYGVAGVDVVVANGRQAGAALSGAPALLDGVRRILVRGPRAGDPDEPGRGLLIAPDFDFAASLAEASRLATPSTLHVFADATDGGGQARLEAFRHAVAATAPGMSVVYHVDQTAAALRQTAAALPPDAAVYVLGIFRDGAGQTFRRIDALRRITKASAAPVFTYWVAEGAGAVGGYVLAAEALGRAAGQAIVQGPHTGLIRDAGLAYVYDWRALVRWGLDDRPLPESATVLFRTPTLWQAYRTELTIAAVAAAALAGVIALLLAALVALRRRERALAQSELRFRAMADNIPQLAWMADAKGWIFWFNKRWRDYTGQSTEAMQGWGWRSVHHPDHVDRVVTRIQHAWDEGQPWEDTFPLRGADGDYRWFLSRARPVRDAKGEVSLWFGTNTDITAQLAAEEALRQSEDRLTAVIDQLSEGLMIYEADGRLLRCNPEARALLGLNPDSDPPPDLAAVADRIEVRTLEGERVKPESGVVARVLAGEAVRNEEYRVTAKSGGPERVVSCSGSLVRAEGGQRLMVLVLADVTERRQEVERRDLLMREVDHRARNVLAVVRAVVKLTKADTVQDFVEAVDGRVTALARTHSLLAATKWGDVSLKTVLEAELSPYLGAATAARGLVDGPSVMLRPEAAQSMALLFHELATNAAKYGALSCATGRVDVTWTLADEGLRLIWVESGGPPAREPERAGFGARLIDGAVGGALGSKVTREWSTQGLRCVLALTPAPGWRVGEPLAGAEATATPREEATPSSRGAATRGRRVLVVEDEALIAAAVAQDLRKARCDPLGPAATLEAAIRMARETPDLDAALVDMNLNGEASLPVIEALTARGVPYCATTGYADAATHLPVGALVLQKPYSADQFSAALKRLLA